MYLYFIDPPDVTGFTNKTILSQTSVPESLVCDVQSYPMSTITWYKNGVLMTDSPVDNIEITETVILDTTFDKRKQSTLSFTTLTKLDSANYTCKATNALGAKELKTHMIVHCMLLKSLFCFHFM